MQAHTDNTYPAYPALQELLFTATDEHGTLVKSTESS